MKATGSLQLLRQHFDASQAACEGHQLAAVVLSIDEAVPGMVWYASDVSSIGAQMPDAKGPHPTLIGTAKDLAAIALRVDQFESGVFAAVPADIALPHFREGGMWTEDDEFEELGESLAEVRTFDTSWIEVWSADEVLLSKLAERFGAEPRLPQ